MRPHVFTSTMRTRNLEVFLRVFTDNLILSRRRFRSTILACNEVPGMAEMSALQDYYIHYFREFRCQDCGSDVAYLSRPRTVSERYILRVLGLKMVRCADCFRRFARPLSLPAREREDPRKAPHSQTPVPPVTGTRVA